MPVPNSEGPTYRHKGRARSAGKRDQIIDVASAIINERGLKGMTFRDVAERVDLTTPSIAHYFRRKELLAEAVFGRRLDQLEQMVDDASSRPDPRARIEQLLAATFDHHLAIRRGEAPPLANFSGMATLEEALRLPLEQKLQAIFAKILDLFGRADTPLRDAILRARKHMLIGLIFFLPGWLRYYSTADFPRVRLRLTALLIDGLCVDGRNWMPAFVTPRPSSTLQQGAGSFMQAATRLLNDKGYAGTSVDDIAQAIGVTKGSFYHHVKSKDDFVRDCINRNHERVSDVISRAQQSGDCFDQIVATLSTLLSLQFDGTSPLLRSTAWGSLPPLLHLEFSEQANRLAIRFAGIISDGMAEGSMRSHDALITAQVIVSLINTAYDLQAWAEPLPMEQAISLYASTIINGLFDERLLSA